MLEYILKRIVLMVPTLFLVLLTNFAIIQVAPGGPVEQAVMRAEQRGMDGESSKTVSLGKDKQYLGSQGLSPEMVEQIKQQYGFDKPAPERFLMMVKNYLTFNFGDSFFKGKPVIELIKEKIPVSVSLGLWSTLLIYIIAIPMGVRKARYHNSIFDRTTAVVLLVGYSIPAFILAILLLVFFAGGSYFQWFPLQGLVSDNFSELGFWGKVKDYIWHMILPVTVSTVGGFATLAYLTKFSFMEELSKQYVQTARAKGLSENQVLYGHVFRNAMLVVISSIPAAIVSIFFTANFLIEIVFNLDGLGLLSFEALQSRDYPVIFGTLYLFTLLGLVLNLVRDVMYSLIDPRIDFAERGVV